MEIQDQSSVATKLLRAVIAKSFLEIALVCVVATLAAFATFSPQLRGAIDVAEKARVAGWVHDPRSPDKALEVQLFIDGKFVATEMADDVRDDLVKAGATTRPNHGFNFNLASVDLPNGEHLIQVFAVRNASAGSKVMLLVTRDRVVVRVNGH